MIVSIRGRNVPDHHPVATSSFVAQQIVKWDNRVLEDKRRGFAFGRYRCCPLNIEINQERMRGESGRTWWQSPSDNALINVDYQCDPWLGHPKFLNCMNRVSDNRPKRNFGPTNPASITSGECDFRHSQKPQGNAGSHCRLVLQSVSE